ncbi:MAG: hypothetical protein WBE31_15715, partial [Candidatus Sulfotelmatobacter sp.]
MDKIHDQQTRTQTKTRLVEQITVYLHSCDYSRALDLLRGTAAEFPNDAELSELEKLAQDGVKRNAEANRLITESQELFAQRNSAEAIQLLRKAYELDKRNALARSILANALVEQAHSVLETDWLDAETLTNQALALNPAHPTAKTILSLIVARKEASSVEDWVARARKLQASSDAFAALAWVAEGLAVHPHDPKLLLIQDEIQRDQDARRRLARRGDLEDLRRMQREIDGATDVAAKQALAVRIQTVAAKYWTDGEILSIANALLLRLGLISQEGSGTSPRGKNATVILHVPRPSAPETSRGATSQITPSAVPESPVPAQNVPTAVVPPNEVQPSKVPPSLVPPSEVRPRRAPPSIAPVRLVLSTPPQAATPPTAELSKPPAKITSPPSRPKQPASPNSTTLVFVAAAVISTAIIMVAATFFFTRKHYASPVAQTQPSAPIVPAPDVSAPAQASPAQTTPVQTNPAQAPSTQTPPETSLPALRTSSGTAAGEVTLNVEPPAGSGHNPGTLLVIVGQDDARVSLDGKLQAQPTQAGQLRLPNLEPRDYDVQVSKSGFQDPP